MNYPECAKLRGRRAELTTVIGFLNWLETQGYWPYNHEIGDAMRGSAQQITLRYLGIDEALLDGERRHMLANLIEGA